MREIRQVWAVFLDQKRGELMHLAQIEWVQKVKGAFPDFFQDKRVLDVGSLNVNGTTKEHFSQCSYYGIDLGVGDNVDFVSRCHEFNPKKFGLDFDQFDTIISTECFEHDEYYAESLRNICRLLRPGGLFIFTCASTGREEHVTAASNSASSPFTHSYYKNLTEADIRGFMDCDLLFSQYQFNTCDNGATVGTDLRFFGVKKSKSYNKPRVICYYLTQFHRVPENDEWWGEGFTEWTNVRKATPLFEGHYQPHVPRDGYYDLMDDPQTFRHQIDLAKQYGIGGFCFYYYWFNGRRLLEKPLEMFLNDSSLDMPFCLMWANETWSRRWDGSEHEILVQQRHNDEDDISFIASLKPYLLDSRYIRIDGKPLISLYRRDLFPNITSTVMRWRTWCRENGVGEIYVVNVLTREKQSSHSAFDCALEFPPHGLWRAKPLYPSGLATNFDGGVYGAEDLLCRDRDFPTFKCVSPSWDNTPRLGLRSSLFNGTTPALFQKRLAEAFRVSHYNTVFVNAWNEWGEGAHLEPDMKWGDAYLQATKNALQGVREMKINLGCGRNIMPGYFNVDCQELPGVDLVCDCNLPIPLDDNIADEIVADDFLEHINNDKRIHIISEIWRILKPGGILRSYTPSTDGRGAFQDPTHYSFWNENSFMYYIYDQWRQLYSIVPKFEVIELNTKVTDEGLKISHVTAVLRAVKPYSTKLAVVVHAYYPELLEELLASLFSCYSPKEVDLFITTTHDKLSDVADVVKTFPITATIDSYENRGKDISPFLATARTRLLGKYAYFLKLHTKLDNKWRTDLLSTLLNPALVTKLKGDFTIGLIGSKGHLLPLYYTMPSDRPRVEDFAKRLGSSGTEVFTAGSMFYGRVDILPILLEAAAHYTFEDEAGQRDGTFAHIIERTFVMAAHRCGTKLIDSEGAVITKIAEGTPFHGSSQPELILSEKDIMSLWGKG